MAAGMNIGRHVRFILKFRQ